MEEKNLKILKVEDEEISRNLYRLWLKNYNISLCDSDKSRYKELSEDNFSINNYGYWFAKFKRLFDFN